MVRLFYLQSTDERVQMTELTWYVMGSCRIVCQIKKDVHNFVADIGMMFLIKQYYEISLYGVLY